MKRTALIILGALLGIVISYVVIAYLSTWYQGTLAKSQDDATSVAGVILLTIAPACLIAGGLLGNWLFRRTVKK